MSEPEQPRRILRPSDIDQFSPWARLARHIRVLAELTEFLDGKDKAFVTAKGDRNEVEIDISTYRFAVEVAEARSDNNLELLRYLSEADHELDLLVLLHHRNWLFGKAHLGRLDEARETANENSREPMFKRRRIVAQLLAATNREKGALISHLQERLKDDHGIVVTSRTIRRDVEAVRQKK